MFPVGGCLLAIVVSLIVGNGSKRGLTEVAVLWTGRAAFVCLLVLLCQGAYRSFKPPEVLSIEDHQIRIRCRSFRLGWLDRWRYRTFPLESITLDIGLRQEFPMGFDTAMYGYVFLVVETAGKAGAGERFYYAPAQRVGHWQEMIRTLMAIPELEGKVRIGKTAATGWEPFEDLFGDLSHLVWKLRDLFTRR